MKREDFWWIDGNNNKWDTCFYTEDEAEKCSKSLTNCDNCINCRNCINCNSCIRCDSCINCDNCINCDSCNGYTTNPSMYITQNIGSRNDQTIFYYGKTDKGMSVQIRCGCFHGNLKEFAEAVERTHGDNKYGKQYRREIEKVKALFELEEEENENRKMGI